MTGWFIVCGTLLAVLLLLQTTSLRHKGLTTDEPLHYQYGYRVLNGTSWRTGAINSSTMPFSSLHVMTSADLALLAQTAGVSPRHFVGRSGKAGPVRDDCSFVITGAVRIEVEL